MLLPSSSASVSYVERCRMIRHTPWSEHSSTTGSITITTWWLHRQNTSSPNYSLSFALRLGWYYDYLVAHLFPASMRVQLHWLNINEWIHFKIALLAYKSILGLVLQHIYPNIASLSPVFRVALIFDQQASGKWLCQGQKLWRSALEAFSGPLSAPGTLSLFRFGISNCL